MTEKRKGNEPNVTGNNGCAWGCLTGAILLPAVVTGIGFLLVGIDGQFGLTLTALIPIGAITGAMIGAAIEAIRKRDNY